MNKIVEIEYKGDYTIWMRFADGFAKEVDFKPIIGEGVSAPLLNPEYFRQVAIDNGGGLEWPNGFDCGCTASDCLVSMPSLWHTRPPRKAAP
jgi:hypothetical protein